MRTGIVHFKVKPAQERSAVPALPAGAASLPFPDNERCRRARGRVPPALNRSEHSPALPGLLGTEQRSHGDRNSCILAGSLEFKA